MRKTLHPVATDRRWKRMVSRSVATACRRSPVDPHSGKEEVELKEAGIARRRRLRRQVMEHFWSPGSQTGATYRRSGLIRNHQKGCKPLHPVATVRRWKRIGGARYSPISDQTVALESLVEWPDSASARVACRPARRYWAGSYERVPATVLRIAEVRDLQRGVSPRPQVPSDRRRRSPGRGHGRRASGGRA
jgi:hypothetical protein